VQVAGPLQVAGVAHHVSGLVRKLAADAGEDELGEPSGKLSGVLHGSGSYIL
jgi:hypothetical protein